MQSLFQRLATSFALEQVVPLAVTSVILPAVLPQSLVSGDGVVAAPAVPAGKQIAAPTATTSPIRLKLFMYAASLLVPIPAGPTYIGSGLRRKRAGPALQNSESARGDALWRPAAIALTVA